jgi:hypothetical protein
MNKASWIQNAYKSTQVNWARSQQSMMKILGDVGIEQIRFTNLPDRHVLEFVSKEENKIPRGVRIVTPLISKVSDDPIKRNKELNVIHRILFNHLKAKFIAIASGLTEFEQEFMAHLIITDKQGNSTTLGEQMLPQYNKHIEKGGGDFLLGDGNKSN